MHLTRIIAVGVLIAAIATPAEGARKKKKKEEVNYIDLATVMIRDGHYDRAQQALAQVDLSAEGVDLGRFHTLRGLVELHSELYRQAADDFSAAVESGADSPIVQVYLGQALFYSKDFRGAITALDRAGAKADEIPGTYAMRAEAYWHLEDSVNAWRTLEEGTARHPTFTELVRRKIFLAVQLGLYQVAAELGREYLKNSEATYEDQLAIGQALVRSGSVKEGLEFLERAHLQYPERPAVLMDLAKVYQGLSMYRTAATLLEPVALTGDANLAGQGAELYRAAGMYFQALALNARIPDSKARLRQRLAILLDMQRYDMVASMARDLTRVGLIQEDENIRYAVAFAYFKERDYERAETLLKGIRDPSLFRKATEVRKAMEDCRDQMWKC
ncbi:MAG: hypothetical protein H6730_34000 [Deltaproteobacteria bacterium]|nr:hypothetical protein [Deltaproteobacteria bacterium]